jgi:flagellar biosynthesis/type III secretory pathway M-ring protein FliF/YscJ
MERAMIARLVTVVAQNDDGIIPTRPDEGGALAVWIVLIVVLVGIYFLIQRTRRRSEQAYWERQERERQRRLNDPDMRKPDDD